MSHQGPSSRKHAKGKAGREDNRGRAECLGNGVSGEAQTKAPRGHSLRPIRATVPGFSVSGVGLDLTEILNQHALVYGQVATIMLYCHSRRPSQSRRGSHVPEVRMAPERARTASLDPHRPRPLRAPAAVRVASRARPRPAQVRRGTGRRGLDGRSDRGRAGCLGRPRGPRAAPDRGRRA